MLSWQKVFSREYSVQYSEIALRSGSLEAKPLLGGFLTDQVMVPEGHGIQSFYVDSSQWAELNNAVEQTHASGASRFERFTKTFARIGDRYVAVSRALGRHDCEPAEPDEWAAAYRDFIPVWRDYCSVLWAGWMLNERFSMKAEALLTQKAGVEKGKALAASVLHPSRKTDVAMAHDELSRMKKEGFSEDELAAFHAAFSWLPCLDLFNAPWTLDDVRKAVASAKPDKTVKKTVALDSILERLDLSDSEEFVLNAAHDLVFIKDQRDVYRRKGVFHSLAFFDKVGRICGQSFADVAYWTHDELLAWSQGGPVIPIAEVKRRKEGFLLFEKDGRYVCLSADAVKPELKKLGVFRAVEKKAASVKGVVGSRGHACGVAKIVRNVADLDKVKTGDVMVAITTHPDFVPAMPRACAIVTDEGGITSHAAIVSREFGIPCVVGTKTATKAFKDGDRVVVDAEKGFVKKAV